MSRIPVTVKDVRHTDERPTGPTLKYLGHDKHAEKLSTGKFGSNVAPKRAGQGVPRPEKWVCDECGHENREYHKTCFGCNAYTRPF